MNTMTANTTAAFKAEQAALRKEYLEIIARRESNPDYWLPYYDKHAGHFARLSNGDIVVISKPRIETRFCFGESGYDYDEAVQSAEVARTSEAYFKRENLSELRHWISVLENPTDSTVDVLVFSNDSGIASVTYCSPAFRLSLGVGDEVSETDRVILLDAYRAAYAAFEKRLDTYLKRYGLSKVRAWTYWRDA